MAVTLMLLLLLGWSSAQFQPGHNRSQLHRRYRPHYGDKIFNWTLYESEPSSYYGRRPWVSQPYNPITAAVAPPARTTTTTTTRAPTTEAPTLPPTEIPTTIPPTTTEAETQPPVTTPMVTTTMTPQHYDTEETTVPAMESTTEFTTVAPAPMMIKLPLAPSAEASMRSIQPLETTFHYRKCPAVRDPRFRGPSGEPLAWPSTSAGEQATPENEACVDSELRTVFRLCIHDEVTREVYWGEPTAQCHPSSSSSATIALLEASRVVVTASNAASVTQMVSEALQRAETPCSGDVLLVADILEKVTEAAHALTDSSMPQLSYMLDGVLRASGPPPEDMEKIEKDAQASKSILGSMDTILGRLQLNESPNGVASAYSPRAAMMVADVARSGITGVAALPGYGDDRQVFTGVRELRSNGSGLEHGQEVELAARLQGVHTRGRATFVLVGSPRTFPVSQPGVRLNSRVVGVTLSDTGFFARSPSIEFEVRPQSDPEPGTRRYCAYWDLEEGIWSTKGCRLVRHDSETGRTVCFCTHLTHFGEIIGVGGHSAVLDVVSIVGCVLSLLGLLGIGLTAGCFKQWRDRLGNKILLHLSGAIALTMVVFLAVASGGSAGGTGDPGCIFLGVLLHYSVLASFCWMLVSASLQMLRFVVVISARPPHFLLKGILLGWGSPLIPVLALLIAGPTSSYPAEIRDDGSGAFCYPQGLSLILAIVVPVATVVLANLAVFSIIIYCVSCGRSKKLRGNVSAATERRMAMRQVRMSILLFFLLGLSWIFGLLAFLSSESAWLSLTFSYIFCITSTMQGLVLFLFFVVWERKTRAMWLSNIPMSLRSLTTRGTSDTVTTVMPQSTGMSTAGTGASIREQDRTEEEAPLRQRNPEPDVKTPIKQAQDGANRSYT